MATVATCRHLQGRAEAAIELAERTVAGVEPGDRPPPTLFRVIGMAKAATGDLDGALAAFTEAEALARQRGVDVLVREATICRAWVRAEQGAADEALAALRAVVDDADAAGDGVNATWARMADGSGAPPLGSGGGRRGAGVDRRRGARPGLPGRPGRRSAGPRPGGPRGRRPPGGRPSPRRAHRRGDPRRGGDRAPQPPAHGRRRPGSGRATTTGPTSRPPPRPCPERACSSRVGDDLFPLPDGRRTHPVGQRGHGPGPQPARSGQRRADRRAGRRPCRPGGRRGHLPTRGRPLAGRLGRPGDHRAALQGRSWTWAASWPSRDGRSTASSWRGPAPNRAPPAR